MTGAGEVDLVLIQGAVAHLELAWEDPRLTRLFERLGSFARLIRRPPGHGHVRPAARPGHPREQVGDFGVVMDAAGSQRGEVHTAGDGFLATFDSPRRAIECAREAGEAVRTIGLEIRAGVHTGEIELAVDDVQGIAVHIGARVSALADAGEVLVSSTVKDLVAGSGLAFEDRGEQALKGVPGTWRVYAVAP